MATYEGQRRRGERQEQERELLEQEQERELFEQEQERELFEQEQEHYGNLCDESKCVSSGGLSKLDHNFFTCYGDDEVYPMMCADGYLPRAVESESPVEQFDATVRLQYFTCCPPTPPTEAIVARHCSDPMVTDLEGATDDDTNANEYINEYSNATRICNDNNRPHYRQMKSRRDYHSNDEIDVAVESHLCCDSILAADDEIESIIDFLDDTECVPYHNEFYTKSKLRNKYGLIAAMTCNFPEDDRRYRDFVIPRLLERNDGTLSSIGYEYECCKTGPASPPFVRDSAFGLTIYPQIVISSIAVASSIVIIIGLLTPLLVQVRKRRKMSRAPSTAFSVSSRRSGALEIPKGSQRSNAIPKGSQRSNLDSVGSRGSLRRKRPSASSFRFSTYNLYLVYLAIPDLFMNLYILGMYGSYASNRTFNPGFCGFIVGEVGGDECIVSDEDGIVFTSILSGYWTANIYLNGIVAYEVFALLRDSQNFQKHNQPSIRKVTLQATAVFFLSIVVATSYFFLSYGVAKAENDGVDDLASTLFMVQKILLNAVMLGLVPIVFFPTVCILIWRRGWMPSITASGTSARDRALRELAWYFFRVVAVFAACWIPMTVISSVGGTWKFSIAFLVLAMQQIVSTCVSMTKSDVRKHVIDTFALSCVVTVTPRKREDSRVEISPASAEGPKISGLSSIKITGVSSIDPFN